MRLWPLEPRPPGKGRAGAAIEPQEGPTSQQPREMEALAPGRLRNGARRGQPGSAHRVVRVQIIKTDRLIKLQNATFRKSIFHTRAQEEYSVRACR